MKLLVGVPAYNESEMIGKVLRSLPEKLSKISKIDILVVDDGSTDDTGKISRLAGATVLTHLLNRGLGGALKTIFAYSHAKKYDILVTFDADGQHKADDLPKIIQPVSIGLADVVIGTRWKDSKIKPITRLLVNKIANVVTYLLFGVYTSDSQSGFRAFNKEAIEKIKLKTDGMEVSSEFFKEIKRNKLRFTEIPIETIYTDYSRAKGQKFSDAPNVLFRLLLRLLE